RRCRAAIARSMHNRGVTQASPSEEWLARRGWEPFAFQRDVWAAIAEGRSGLLHATTGSGKTYAVWLGMLDRLLANHGHERGAQPLRAVWLTPMRALAADTTRATAEPLRALAPEWTIGQRTGDTQRLGGRTRGVRRER